MELDELIGCSAGSQFLDYCWEDGTLTFSLYMAEFGAQVDFTVRALAEPVTTPIENEAMRACRIVLEKRQVGWELKLQGVVTLLSCLVESPGHITWESGSE